MAENALLMINLAVCAYGLYQCFHRLCLVNGGEVPTRVRTHVYLQAISFLIGAVYPAIMALSWYTTFLLAVFALQVWTGREYWSEGIPRYLRHEDVCSRP